MLANPPGRLDKVERIAVVLFDTGGNRKYIRVEDDVLARKPHLLGKERPGALADGDSPRGRIGLALLVKGHHDNGRAIATAELGLANELVFAFLHGNRVDDCLTLHTTQARLDDAPLGAIDHDWNAGNVGLGGEQIQKPRHRGG